MNTQRSLSLKWLVPGVVVILVLAVISGGAQRVPPTARQAATMPQFAQQLASHPATTLQRPTAPDRGASCSPSRKGHQARRTSPQDILYDNGPFNGTTDAWDINFGFSVSDSFTVPSGAVIQGISFIYWDASTSDLLTTVDMGIASTSFGGSFQTLRGVTNTFLGTNQYGYALYQADYTFPDVSWSGAGYITLQNACSTSGCSVSNPIYWDENSGPSTAYENTIGSIPSETFTLTGYVGLPHSPCMPEQSGGFKVIHDFSGQGDGLGPNGVVMNAGGSLFGATQPWTGGTIYKLWQAGSDWILNTLFAFPSDGSGNDPEGVIIGLHGILYGAYYGRVPICDPGQFCGSVFSVRPAPTACRSSSCGWVENTLYNFTAPTDAWWGRSLVTDRAGNLYGVSEYGGASQQGAVFELTPAGTAWIETILYNFTGGSDGGGPTTLLLGNDGNLYGMGERGGANAGGVVFRLSPSGGGWSESVLYDLPYATYGTSPHSLIQDSAGNLLGEYEFLYQVGNGQWIGVVFMLAPSGGNWIYTQLRQGDEQLGINDTFANLTFDAAQNLWGTGGGTTGCSGSVSLGYIFELARNGGTWQYSTPVYWDNTEFSSDGALAMDAQGNLYGTTYDCGSHGGGTVWEFTPTQ